MNRARAVAALAVAVLFAAGGVGSAHTGGTTAYASIVVDGAGVRYRLTLWPAAVPPAVAVQLRAAGADDAASREGLMEVIRNKVTLVADGRRCTPGAGSVVASSGPDESITLGVEFDCGPAARTLVIRDDLFDVLGADHHTLARIEASGRTTQFAFGADAREARVRAGGGQEVGSGLGSFVRLGIEHIVTGWDHLLFLLGLILPGGGLPALLKIVTAFTVAHSVTLSLAALDVVALPDRLVEATIALSLAAVAGENLFLRPTVTRRWILSFGFGLVHGLGFSSALRETGLPSEGLAIALLGFNAGVELGQVALVGLAVPALVLLRERGWGRRMVWGCSMAILLAGLALFVERALL